MEDFPISMQTDGTIQFEIRSSTGSLLLSGRLHTPTIIEGQQLLRRMVDCTNALVNHTFDENTNGLGRVTAMLANQ